MYIGSPAGAPPLVSFDAASERSGHAPDRHAPDYVRFRILEPSLCKSRPQTATCPCKHRAGVLYES